jgi:L-2-hydroxyglutarate oxidase LhgO
MTADVEVTIIGAGAVGLAIGRELALAGKEVAILESEEAIGQGMSSRNSEVIHAGIYYPPDSLKSRLCIAGRDLLYHYAAERDIAHASCGKLIVATDPSQLPFLKKLRANSEAAGLSELQWLDAAGITRYCQHTSGLAALWSPRSGIIDAHGYMDQLARDFAEADGNLVVGNTVTGIAGKNDVYVVKTADGESFTTRTLINSAGLYADTMAALAGMDVVKHDYRQYWVKGHYFRWQNAPEFKSLIYPVPPTNLSGLGIHLTIDVAGGVKFGPDVLYLESRDIDYRQDADRREVFYEAVKGYLPMVKREDLLPDTTGIRAKRQKPGEGFKDFVIREESDKGYPGFVNLIGIESPGLTASLAIAKYIQNLIR